MKTLFERYLRLAKEKNQLISIRTDNENADKFSVGYVLGINDDVINIKAVNPKGQPDGVYTVQTEDIYGLDIDDKYLKRLQLKLDKQKEIFADTSVPSIFMDGEVNIRKIIEKAKEQKQLIHVNFYRDIGLYGFINEVLDDEFVIEVYDEHGEYDGISIFIIDDIRNINWDDEDIRVVDKLRVLKNTGPNNV